MKTPPMYCITLKQTPERRQAAAKHFKETGLDVKMVAGFHGPSLGIKTTIPFHCNGGVPFYCNAGHCGLVLSHIMLWNMALHAGHEEVIIFEDDARVVPDFKHRIPQVLKELPTDWNIVYLEHCCTEGKPAKRISPMLCEIRWPLCTAALMIRRKALTPLIQNVDQLWSHIDIIMEARALPKIGGVYCCVPPLVKQLSRTGQIPSAVHNRAK